MSRDKKGEIEREEESASEEAQWESSKARAENVSLGFLHAASSARIVRRVSSAWRAFDATTRLSDGVAYCYI